MDIILGVIGAIVGGLIRQLDRLWRVTELLILRAWFIAVVGAVIVLLVYRTVVARA